MKLPVDPKSGQQGISSDGSMLNTGLVVYTPCASEPGVRVPTTEGDLFVPIDPLLPSPRSPWGGYYSAYPAARWPTQPNANDAPIIKTTLPIDREPPYNDEVDMSIATPCVSPYNWTSGTRTLILDTTPDARATAEEKAVLGYVPNPGLTLSSKSSSIPAHDATINAGNFTVGAVYKIKTIGTTNFIAVGAVSNTVGVSFTATGVGSGSGTAIQTIAAKDLDYIWTYGSSPADPHPGLRSGQTRYSGISGSAVGTVWDKIAFLPGTNPVSGTLKVCAYRKGRFLSSIPSYSVSIKIGKGQAVWSKTDKKLTLSSPTPSVIIKYSLDGSTPTLTYTAPIEILVKTDVRWYITKSDMVDSDEFLTSVSWTDTAPEDFTVSYFSTLPVFANTPVDASFQLMAPPTKYVSPTGTGSGNSPDDPGSALAVIGNYGNVASGDIPKMARGNRYLTMVNTPWLSPQQLIVGQKYRVEVTGSTPWADVGAPYAGVGSVFTATAIGKGNGLVSLQPVLATLLITNQYYRILTLGSSNFVNAGANSNEIGVTFKATGTTTGTGTCTPVSNKFRFDKSGDFYPDSQKSSTYFFAPNQIIDTGYPMGLTQYGDWIPGMQVVISGANSSANNGTYTVKTVGRSYAYNPQNVSLIVTQNTIATDTAFNANTNVTLVGYSHQIVYSTDPTVTTFTDYAAPIEVLAPGRMVTKVVSRKVATSDVDSTRLFTQPAFVGKANVNATWDKDTKKVSFVFSGKPETAGTFTVGQIYTIRSVGDTDWVAIGAASSTIGVTFTATGTGSGTGVAVPVLFNQGAEVIYYTATAATNPTTVYSDPVDVGTTSTYRLRVYHTAVDSDDFSTDTIPIAIAVIDPDNTPSFSTDYEVFFCPIASSTRSFCQPSDIVAAAEGTYLGPTGSASAYNVNEGASQYLSSRAHGLIVRGGYNSDFTERDVQNRKSIFKSVKWSAPRYELDNATALTWTTAEFVNSHSLSVPWGMIDGCYGETEWAITTTYYYNKTTGTASSSSSGTGSLTTYGTAYSTLLESRIIYNCCLTVDKDFDIPPGSVSGTVVNCANCYYSTFNIRITTPDGEDGVLGKEWNDGYTYYGYAGHQFLAATGGQSNFVAINLNDASESNFWDTYWDGYLYLFIDNHFSVDITAGAGGNGPDVNLTNPCSGGQMAYPTGGRGGSSSVQVQILGEVIGGSVSISGVAGNGGSGGDGICNTGVTYYNTYGGYAGNSSVTVSIQRIHDVPVTSFTTQAGTGGDAGDANKGGPASDSSGLHGSHGSSGGSATANLTLGSFPGSTVVAYGEGRWYVENLTLAPAVSN